jgi:four helix bundle protein
MDELLDSEKGVRSFEALRIFQAAGKLCNEIWSMTRTGPACKDLAFSNQVRRSALSILANIAEGFARNSRNEFGQFLSIAKGSCGEVRAQLLVALDQQYISEPQHKRVQNACIRLSSGIAKLMIYLRQHPTSMRRSSGPRT